MLLLENAMAAQDISVPVYFAPWSREMNGIVEDLAASFTKDDKSGSAADAMFNLASANGYQIGIKSSVFIKLYCKPKIVFYGKCLYVCI